ncbi:hypothetical protein GCM10017653_35390 [Ancylobacter defluvii]|uniref:Uncharacterized protein n=1 Tax=Ancylobacter defluvii TaxID=1282440 RepID=A0A9W6JZZ3_9HYPH|nr:hypothetical protein GCM10017653_35390 [Ancylobacter defluvii]
MVFADHYSRLLGSPFELTAQLAILRTFPLGRDEASAADAVDQTARHTNAVIAAFNTGAKNGSPLIQLAGNGCALWTAEPTLERFRAMVDLYRSAVAREPA